MEEIPEELWPNIIKYLPIVDIIRLAKVNKFFFKVTRENKYWNSEGIRAGDYLKYSTFIGHCKTINFFQDFSLGFKYYLSLYPNLNKNKIKTINIRISSAFELEFIRKNKYVRNLQISSTIDLLAEDMLNLLDELNSLKNLQLSNSAIDDRIISRINKYNLDSLGFEACCYLDKISQINQTQLRELKIISQPELKNQEINSLVSKQKKLEYLKLSLTDVNIDTIIVISVVGKNLTFLDLSYSQNVIDDVSVFLLAGHCPKLKTLNLNASDITNDGVFYLTKYCKNITSLSLAGTYINDMALIYIAMYYPEMEYLSLEFNSISRIGIYNIMLRCKKIIYLNILNDILSINYISHIHSLVSINKIFHQLNLGYINN